MKKFFAAGALAVALVSAPAAAQDEGTAGGKFVAGAILGIDSVNVELDDALSDAEEDILVGVTVGYDYETASGVVFGIEGEFSDSSVGASATDVFVADDRLSINAGRDFYAGVRLGFRPGKNGLLYVKGGYTNASIEGEYDDGTGEIADEQAFDGFRVGIGGEIDLGSNYGIRVEYRYSDYGSIEALGVDTGLDISRNQGVITLLGKF
ncbi:outer membrane protein [Erythrobacter oryzae]|uniref:outer membrane protein n=1 Tax=Erythrobacter oryzae TaxID=3019556 RepID=UPI0025531E46|nr:porin family protein [Erythrobacter sp. COR-2]